MKEVTITKDEYIDNSVRVNYLEKDALLIKSVYKINEETGEISKVEQTEKVNKLLFCERLIWIDNENELNDVIKQRCQEWETKINS